MDLAQYIKEKGIKKGFFAKAVGIDPLTLNNIINGKAFTIVTAMAIEDYTKGEVSVMDLINNYKEKPSTLKKKKEAKLS